MLSPYPGKEYKNFEPVVHTVGWIIYAIFIHLVNYLIRPNIKIINTFLFLLPYCLTFYISVYCLGLYKRMGVLWSIASFVIVFIIMSSLAYLYMYVLLPIVGIRLFGTKDFMLFLSDSLLGYVQYFFYAMLYTYTKQSYSRKILLAKAEEARLKSELEYKRLKEIELHSEAEKLQLEFAFIKSQVNPHFLYNTLNELKSHALDYSENLANNIGKLAEIMRYSMGSGIHGNDKVPIEKELDHLQLVIEIYNMRFGDEKSIDFKIEGQLQSQMILHHSMITIVENAFKYGDLKDKEYPLFIRVILSKEKIYFCCRNKKRKNIRDMSSDKIGIANLRRRLEISFKNKYTLNVEDKEDFYQFELTLST